jgi:hypothetical protein
MPIVVADASLPAKLDELADLWNNAADRNAVARAGD